MPLKNWKKKDKDFWMNKDKWQYVAVNPTINHTFHLKYRHTKGSYPYVSKTFKTHSQALKFAKSYMKKH